MSVDGRIYLIGQNNVGHNFGSYEFMRKFYEKNYVNSHRVWSYKTIETIEKKNSSLSSKLICLL